MSITVNKGGMTTGKVDHDLRKSEDAWVSSCPPSDTSSPTSPSPQGVESLVESRHEAYGHPSVNLLCVADLWGTYLVRRQDAMKNDDFYWPAELDVCVFNILQKISRIANTPDHLDSWDDIQGYAECAKKCLAAKE